MPRTARLEAEPAAPPALPRSLDDLADLGCDALLALYRQGSTPAIASVTGDLRGRMLAVRGAGWLFRISRAFARWRFFPWRGKSFMAHSTTEGEGINRVFSDRKPSRWFRFATRIEPSRAGAFDAFQLDYDNPDNPFFIRAIKDELREVAPGLYLGQAYVVISGRPHLALYFGLQQ